MLAHSRQQGANQTNHHWPSVFVGVVVVTLLLGLLYAPPCLAGKNAGGALIVHTQDAYVFSTSTVCTTTYSTPASCEEATTRSDKDVGTVVWLLAAFDSTATPGVSGIYFGIDYHDSLYVDRWKMCAPAGSIELPDSGWPGTGTGNSIAFGTPIVGNRLFPFYAFKIDGGTNGSYFSTAINPTGGYAAFIDDSVPPIHDDILRFGTVRWYTLGENECPVPQAEACCFPSGRCVVLLESDCVSEGGIWQGRHTEPVSCEPAPCTVVCCVPPGFCMTLSATECLVQAGLVDSTWTSCTPSPCPEIPLGACCLPSGTCAVLSELECANAEGAWVDAETTCFPDPCIEPQACCFVDGSCQSLLPEECQAQNGTPNGIGTVCNPNSCPQPQACCFADRSCQILLPEPCQAQNGALMGNETTCDPNPCPDPLGACCYANEDCEYVLQSQCLGSFQGASVPCDPSPCTLGEVGACCFMDGHCEVVPPQDCAGNFVGGTCDPARCSAVPTHRTSWGRLKALYRQYPEEERTSR